jgi:hypothetical protein
MQIALVGSLGLEGLIGLFDSNDDEVNTTDEVQEPEIDTPIEDVTEVDPEPEVEDDLDLGASIIESEDGSLEIELGDDETGSIAAIKVEEFTRNVDGFPVFSLGVYLVPEGVTLPVDPTGNGETYGGPEKFAEAFGLTLLTKFDLGTLADREYLDNEANTLTDPPAITSDEPITILSTYFENPNMGGGGLYFSSNVAETLPPFEGITPFSAG